MKKHQGFCSLCESNYCDSNFESGHHILPKRFFKGKGGIYYMCRKCHNQLERRIPLAKKLPPKEYKKILDDFIKEKQQILKHFKRKEKKMIPREPFLVIIYCSDCKKKVIHIIEFRQQSNGFVFFNSACSICTKIDEKEFDYKIMSMKVEQWNAILPKENNLN